METAAAAAAAAAAAQTQKKEKYKSKSIVVDRSGLFFASFVYRIERIQENSRFDARK